MRTFSFVCALVLLSQAVFAARDIPTSMRQETPAPEAPLPLIPGMAPICTSALRLFQCSCITGIQAFNIPPPLTLTPGAGFVNQMCAPALASPQLTFAECTTFFQENPTTIANILSMTVQFGQECLPGIAGVAGSALSNFVDNIVPAVPM